MPGEEIKKVGQEQVTLITASAQFLTTITKFLFLERRLGTRLYLHPISKFPNIY